MTWLAIHLPGYEVIGLALNFTASLLRSLRYRSIYGGEVNAEMRFIRYVWDEGMNPIVALDAEPDCVNLRKDPFCGGHLIARGDEEWAEDEVPEDEVEIELRSNDDDEDGRFKLELGSLESLMFLAGFEVKSKDNVYEVIVEATRTVTTRTTLNVADPNPDRNPTNGELEEALEPTFSKSRMPGERVVETSNVKTYKFVAVRKLDADEAQDALLQTRLPPRSGP